MPERRTTRPPRRTTPIGAPVFLLIGCVVGFVLTLTLLTLVWLKIVILLTVVVGMGMGLGALVAHAKAGRPEPREEP